MRCARGHEDVGLKRVPLPGRIVGGVEEFDRFADERERLVKEPGVRTKAAAVGHANELEIERQYVNRSPGSTSKFTDRQSALT